MQTAGRGGAGAGTGSVKAPKQGHIWSDLPRAKVGKMLKKDIRVQMLAPEGAAAP